ncbi:RNA methyltransferase substrate-binding domain-containing protein, partial [Listeria monocytogenes]|uniref:RNA methyltransferase substrate-binding domain-containing protein n=1 Tax=Listeria monocytogenes TaxID=1639 RepID=UPI00057F5F62
MEQENEQEWIGGRNPALEVLRFDRDIHKIYVQNGSLKGVLQQVLTLAKDRKIQAQLLLNQKIEKVVSGAHQGLAAQVAA